MGFEEFLIGASAMFVLRSVVLHCVALHYFACTFAFALRLKAALPASWLADCIDD